MFPNDDRSSLWKFAIVIVLTALAAVSGIAGVNFFIDPYGLRPANAKLRAKVASRPAMNYDEYLQKAYGAANAKARSVYFGSSLTAMGMPPDHAGVEQPAYNCGLQGSDTRAELAYLKHTIALGDIRTAYIGIDLLFLITDPEEKTGQAGPTLAPTFRREYLLQRREERLTPAVFSPGIFSLAALKESGKILAQAPYPQTTYAGGLCDESIGRAMIHNDSATVAERFLATAGFRRTLAILASPTAEVDRARLADIREMAAACREAGIKAVVFIQPLGPLVYEKIEEAGGLKALQMAKEAIARVLGEELPTAQIHLYDFAVRQGAADALALESPGSRVWRDWWEATHYRPSFGAKMLDVMTGKVKEGGVGREIPPQR